MAQYIADRRLYLDAEGKVVEADDPRRQRLLVHKGGSLPRKRAEELGLIAASSPETATATATVKVAEDGGTAVENLAAANPDGTLTVTEAGEASLADFEKLRGEADAYIAREHETATAADALGESVGSQRRKGESTAEYIGRIAKEVNKIVTRNSKLEQGGAKQQAKAKSGPPENKAVASPGETKAEEKPPADQGSTTG